MKREITNQKGKLQDKPCLKDKICRYYSKEKGYKTLNQKHMKVYYICGLGVFSMTHELRRIPDFCGHKNKEIAL